MKRQFTFNTSQLCQLTPFKEIQFKDIEIYQVTTIDDPVPNSIYFLKNFSENLISQLEKITLSLIILPDIAREYELGLVHESNSVIYSANPRLDYAIIIQYILEMEKKDLQYKISDYFITKGEDVEIGKHTIIDPFVFLDHGVKIGDKCTIKSGVRIGPRVQIGDHTTIRENSVIGGQGFGVERSENGQTVKIPHIGGVQIGSYVEIGAINTVVTGTIKPTIIGDYVKTDDHIHIAHNCKIGRGTLITACAELSGSVTIGKNGWIGPNSSLMNGITLGNEIMVGLGAVVTKSFGDNEVLLGNPAVRLQEMKTIKKVQAMIMAGLIKDHNSKSTEE